MKDFVKIYKDAWRIVTSCWILWAICTPEDILFHLMMVLRTPSLNYLNCFILPFYSSLFLYVLTSFPYIVARSESGNTCSIQELSKVFLESIARLISILLIIIIIFIIGVVVFLIILIIIALHFGYTPTEFVQPSWIVLLIYLFAFPILNILLLFSISGISLHRLNGFQALINSIRIIKDNLILVLITWIFITLLSITWQAILQAIIGAAYPLREAIFSWSLKPINYFWYFIHAFFYFIISVYYNTVIVLIYLSTTRRIQYRWIKDTNIV